MPIIRLPQCTNEKVPAPTHDFHHFMPFQVRFNDIDIFRHINNSAYLSCMDTAKADYLTKVTGARAEAKNLAAVIVNINCSFFSPGYFEEPLGIVTAVTSVSERSFRMEQRIYNTETGDVKCTSVSILAGFDPETATGMPIPASYKEMIEKFECRQLNAKKTADA